MAPKLRNLKAEAAKLEARRIAVEEARGKVEHGKITTEAAILREQLAAEVAKREAAEALRAAAILERDQRAQERDAAIALAAAEVKRGAEKDAALAEERASMKREVEALSALVVTHKAQSDALANFMTNATARLAAIEAANAHDRAGHRADREAMHATAAAQVKAVADRALAEISAAGRAITTQVASLGSTLRADLSAIASMPMEMTAWDDKDGKTHATMTRRP